jgi:putative ATP-dependent endonuclease of OLD family
MIIKSIHVKNFRSLHDAILPCEQLTALVGANGTGKSSFLRALDLFYSSSPVVELDDCYNKEQNEISIAVTFTQLSAEAIGLFAKYVQGGELTVERVFSWDEGKLSTKYHGASLQNSEFQGMRDLSAQGAQAAAIKAEYSRLRAIAEYTTLPAYSNKPAALDAFIAWEDSNSNECSRQRDEGAFFGFKQVAQGYLGQFTKFLFIPAVREASGDASDAKGSIFTQMMDLVVRSSLASNEAIKTLKEDIQTRYQQLIDPIRATDLSELESRLSNTLGDFAPNTSVKLDWLPLQEIELPLPRADIKLVEDNYAAPVGKTGHGLQRALIVTMLEHLVVAQQSSVAQSEAIAQPNNGGADTTAAPMAQQAMMPDLVLAIEEPELYQHPSRQRHIAHLLMRLASGRTPGVAERTQVIYATHSPLFVGIDRINQVRLLRKIVHSQGMPKITHIVHTDLDSVAERLWTADGCPSVRYTGETLYSRLHTIMTPWVNEGFFANVTVLVEGEDDRAAILGMAQVLGHDLESEGFAIIPCGGKTSLDRPALIFGSLGIPVYLVWDSDKDADTPRPEDNHRLLRIVGFPLEDWPCIIHDRFACFENNLELTMKTEIGPVHFGRLLAECQKEFGIPKKKHAVKNPVVVRTLIDRAIESGYKCDTLSHIATRILAMR